MALTADQITAQNFKDFYAQILPYLNKGNGGTSDTPLGAIEFFEDVVAPYGWLVADGTVYNISDYPDLANHYERVYGAKNHWGGNGTTTFAVADVRGEFLRASGTNSHANQGNGAAVGVHQNATGILSYAGIGTDLYVMNKGGTVRTYEQNADKLYSVGTDASSWNKFTGTTSPGGASSDCMTIRPTNTSFLACVKAIPSSEMNVYSLSEVRCGTWINGKPMYKKTLQIDVTPDTAERKWYDLVNISALNIGVFISADGRWNDEGTSKDFQWSDTLVHTELAFVASKLRMVATGITKRMQGFITIKYTKTTD